MSDNPYLPGNVASTNVGTTSGSIASPNPKRKTIAFATNSTSGVTVVPFSPAVAGQGLTFTVASGMQTLSRDEFGEMVCRQWFGIGGNAGDYITVFDISDGS